MRKWLIGLAFLSSILVMTLFAVEFALNKFALNKKWKSIHNKLVKQNSHGFRYRERTYEKEEGVFRILVLGDSMTKGA